MNVSSHVVEMVTGLVKLSKAKEFERLHRNELLPFFERFGIRPLLLLMTEVGEVGRFVDLYVHDSYEDYDTKLRQVLTDGFMEDYYARVEQCLIGGIEVSLLRPMSYSPPLSGTDESEPGR